MYVGRLEAPARRVIIDRSTIQNFCGASRSPGTRSEKGAAWDWRNCRYKVTVELSVAADRGSLHSLRQLNRALGRPVTSDR
jgi:hypothetical protein